MYVLGIESTAHTFGVGIIDEDFNILADTRSVLRPTNTLGIDPGEAAEHHSKVALDVLYKAFKESGLKISDIDLISFSKGPGLGPALRIGATLARGLALKYNKPIYPVHHGLGHVELTVHFTGFNDPLVLLVSGGHTAILAFNKRRWRVYGETLDITIGNLLDSFARKLGIGFPGGPVIEGMASGERRYIELPYNVKGNNVVYSGLLTKAIELIGKYDHNDLAYSLQETAFAMLVEVTERALIQTNKKGICIAGGVASNNRLFEMMRMMADEHNVKVGRLEGDMKRLNSDNGVQIALLGLLYYKSGVMPVKVENSYIYQRIRIDEEEVPWRNY